MRNIFRSKVVLVSFTLMFLFGLSSLLYFYGESSSYLKTSVLDLPAHAPFDGTVYPLQKAPNWVSINSSDWTKTYNNFSQSQLVDLPYYNPSELSRSVDTLTWGNPADDLVRNAKITYSVPYLGNYKLDGKENAGSHPAVDIKVPEGTPVFSIANGVVIKAVMQDSGFGAHIVIQHNNVPSLNNENVKETLYSSYNHLSNVFVEVGDVVVKGEQIGLTGSTGTSTTPHLHFQIDNSSAPWHPYWPFTWQEVTAAGLNFFSAINEGLGQDKAKQTTINPMKYVQKYLDASSVSVTNSGNSNAGSYIPIVKPVPAVVEETVTIIEVTEDTVEENGLSDDVVVPDDSVAVDDPIVIEDPVVPDAAPMLNIDFDVSSEYKRNLDYNFSLKLVDQFGEKFDDGISTDFVISSDNGKVKVINPIVRNRDFDSNFSYRTSFNAKSEGKDRFKVEYGGETYYSEWFNISTDSSSSLFSDLTVDNKHYDAISYLSDIKVVAGYPDGTFKPNNTVSRVEALKFILAGTNADLSLGDLPFSDVASSEWYSQYLYTAYVGGVAAGYPDGTFKPANTVNKAEFYKLLFIGMGVDVNPNLDGTSFSDVSVDDWFAPYVEKAKELGIIDSNVTILNGSAGMSRAEVAEAIYRVVRL